MSMGNSHEIQTRRFLIYPKDSNGLTACKTLSLQNPKEMFQKCLGSEMPRFRKCLRSEMPWFRNALLRRCLPSEMPVTKQASLLVSQAERGPRARVAQRSEWRTEGIRFSSRKRKVPFGRHQTCQFRKHVTSAPAEFGGETCGLYWNCCDGCSAAFPNGIRLL